ncbi:MAG TPA: hypothetical protein VLG13_00110 [Patescibacteria group bacterium]|nr:hypothetical protein [Patescibacteria group bacterium]
MQAALSSTLTYLRTPLRIIKQHQLAVRLTFLVLILGGVWFYSHAIATSSPVPQDIRKAVSFTVYYPDQKRLPQGYSLDTTTFRQAEPGVVLFSLQYYNGKRMVFSEEQKPASDVINKFVTAAIPLHTELTTPLGKAEVGVYGNNADLHSVVSLPISNGPWLIITAPADINQPNLTRILNSLTK